MSHSLLTETLRRTYVAQRGVSQGASVTLTAGSGGYSARFECAQRCASVLGTRNFYDNPPFFEIPTEDLHKSITKLSETFSVALLDTVTDDQGTRFVLVWKVNPSKPVLPALIEQAQEKELVTVSQGDSLDDY